MGKDKARTVQAPVLVWLWFFASVDGGRFFFPKTFRICPQSANRKSTHV
jgi:hypothetical protein